MAGFSLHVAQVMNACIIPGCYSFLSGFALCPCQQPELAMAGKMGPVDFDCCVLVPLQWGSACKPAETTPD